MNRLYLFASLFASALIVAACSPSSDEGETSEATEATEAAAEAMDDGAASGASEAVAEMSSIDAAVNSPARPDAARGRDEGRKPAEVLAFYGVEPGMALFEFGAGGGYYTEILSVAVGPEGKVIAQNSPGDFYENRIKANFEPLTARLPNVEPYIKASADFDVADNSLDGAFIILIYHHMHYNAEQGEVLPESSREILGKLLTALKPGGFLGVIEHAAPDDATRESSAPLHRVPPGMAKADITGLGYEFAGESDLLLNSEDDRSVYWRGSPYQGKTARFVHKYVKPTG